MLVIRFFRVGKKNQPSFKIVVTDKRKPPRAGRFIEEVGFWNPLTKEKVLRQERIKYWLSVGAEPSPTVHNLLVSEKIIDGKKIAKHKKAPKESKLPTGQAKKEEPVSEKPAEEKPIPEAKKEEPAQRKPTEKKPTEEPKTEEKPKEEKPEIKEEKMPAEEEKK